MKTNPFEIVLRDFPQAEELIKEGVITERSAEIYAIRRRFLEIKDKHQYTKDACIQLEEEFPKSERSIYRYVRSLVIK